ncbi:MULTISPECIES: FAD-dependent monooxygenase [unclassified Nocardioides]|uniref:FAD-dependent monooxygenase n=1 Tax=unclassified Nocardioides TaxID=2615069 RepID=UPI0006FF3D36|nr:MULTISPECIES: FAD-dependent monooxygenase [unclassified Nocardioides]KQY50905.1 salicylate hydroxylase [Nocardioides sp. Root140]KRF14672.1 salicylate hydroxylase [Nocardioides sp. Soil796]
MRVGIIGGGIGGLAAAIALELKGVETIVLEQAPGLGRVGADINLTPNAVRALDGLGVGDRIRETAARPTHRISRTWDTGEETSRLPMSDAAQERYGAPQLTMHRADLLDALTAALPADRLRLGKRLVRIEEGPDSVVAHLEDGSTETVDLLVGADGIHSVVRSALLGEEHPEFTGVVAYRAVVPVEAVSATVQNLDAFTKWWGPDAATQIVTFPLNQGKDVFIFATTPQDSWREESWTCPGDVVELRAAYADFHPEARTLLDACTSVLKSALYVRDPLTRWSTSRVTLLGDACHPMMPFMAQGAGQAIEDAVVLSRCLTEPGDDIRPGAQRDPAARLQRYEGTRRERTALIQVGSRENNWLKAAGNGDWVYEYDAWTVPLA